MEKRILSLIMAAALLLPMLAGSALAAGGGNIAAESRSGVARVLSLGPDGNYSTGSAFGVGEAGEETVYFVTNHHVVYGTYSLESGGTLDLPAVSVWLLKNSSAWNPATGLDISQAIPCEIVYAEEDGYPDIAVLKAVETLEGRVALPLLADEAELGEGDAVYALGYPGSSDYTEQGIYGKELVAGVEDVTITSGVVSRFTTAATWGNTRLIQHDAQINHGNSGGPLIDSRGAVVGINTYIFGHEGMSSGDKISSASVRIRYVTEVLDDLEIPYDVYREGPGAVLWIVLAVVAVAVIAVVVVLVLRRGRKPAKPAAPAAPAAPVADPGAVPASAPPDSGWRIQGQSGHFSGRRFAVNGQVRIGRDGAKNDLVYPANTQGISGVHCVVRVEGGQIVLQDLGSTYGTFVGNGQRLAAQQAVMLKVGERFYLGSEKECFVVARKGGV